MFLSPASKTFLLNGGYRRWCWAALSRKQSHTAATVTEMLYPCRLVANIVKFQSLNYNSIYCKKGDPCLIAVFPARIGKKTMIRESSDFPCLSYFFT